MKFVALAAGHNPQDQGYRFTAPGDDRTKDLTEWALTSEIADRVQEILAVSRLPLLRVPEFPGPGPESLDRAIRYCRGYAEDLALAVDLHYNSAPDGSHAEGTEIIVKDGAASDTRACAAILLKEVLQALGTRDRGVRNASETPHRRLAWCSRIPAPSCILEVGFLSSAADRERTASLDGRKRAAKGIARAFALIHGR